MTLTLETATPWMALLFGMGLALTSLGSDWATAATEEDLQKNRLKLNQILKSLNTQTKELRSQEGMETGILGELENVDKQLVELADRRDTLSRQVQEAQQKLPELAQTIELQQKKLEKIHTQLSSHVRLMYGLGSQGVLRVALSQKTVSAAYQGIQYYGQLVQSRKNQFRLFSENIEKLRQSTENHKTLLAEAKSLADELVARQVQLEKTREERTQILASVRVKKNRHQQKVEELQRARKMLGAFVDKLNDALPPLPVQPQKVPTAPTRPQQSATTPATPATIEKKSDSEQEVVRITQQKGRLAPPIKGRQSQSQPPGIFYQVEGDTRVKAIYRGQAVYADWFRGYGLLVILNHGDHVYSLYGHNRKLLVAPGDWVETQDTIAESGDTGSLEGVSGLYFEIRDKGQTVNPKQWLSS